MQRNVRFYKDLLKSTKAVQVPLSPLNTFKTPANSGGLFFGVWFWVWYSQKLANTNYQFKFIHFRKFYIFS